MRLFVAVPVPEDLRGRVAKLAEELPREGISPVKAGNMHATLKFIGEVDDGKLGDITQRLGKIRFGKFDCIIKGVGVFPSESYIKVVWAGIESGGALESLAKDVISSLHGYGQDERFTAHLTIARVKKKLDLKAFLERHAADEFGSFGVSGFELIQSVLRGAEGPEYKTMAQFGAEG